MTPPTPSCFNRGTSLGNGTAPSRRNWITKWKEGKKKKGLLGYIIDHKIKKKKPRKNKNESKINLIDFVPPSELSLDFVTKYIIQKGRVEEDPSTRPDQRSLSVSLHYLRRTATVVVSIMLRVVQLLDLHLTNTAPSDSSLIPQTEPKFYGIEKILLN